MSRRIAVIAPIAARYDAISAAAADDFRLLQAEPDWDVTFLTSHNELDLPARIVHGVAGLLDDAAFRSADVLIYHFGIYHSFVDALLIGNGHARQIVVFHNITPPDLVSSTDRPIIEMSLRQAHNLRSADEIWAVSAVNAEALDRFGIDPKRVLVVPLAVNRPSFARLRDKLGGRLEFLFVGRIVAAKGVRDLIEAVIRARPAIAAPIRISIAGNAAFSDLSYIDGCKARIAEASLQDCFELIDTPSDEVLCTLYARAHVLCVPSFHEGFCVPVIEGLRAGCIPVGYASGNVPNVADRVGRLVASGDVVGLGDALVDVSRGLIEASRNPRAACLALDCGTITVDDFDRRARDHAETFDFVRVAAIKIGHIRRLLQGLGPNPYTAPSVTAAPARPPRGRVFGVLNRLTRMPECHQESLLSQTHLPAHPLRQTRPKLPRRCNPHRRTLLDQVVSPDPSKPTMSIKPPAKLRPAHFADAHLFADRIELIKSLSYLKHARVAELGVAFGDFSRVIIDELNPADFHAYDIFRFHEYPVVWGKPTAEILNGLQHKAFYEARFEKEIRSGQVSVFEGDSVTRLVERDDEFYDIIYIDADHQYEGVLRDTKASIRKLKHGGTLIFNDYIMYDHITGVPYGIVQVVNDLCVNDGWQITHFAFEPNMFCDVALRRKAD